MDEPNPWPRLFENCLVSDPMELLMTMSCSHKHFTMISQTVQSYQLITLTNKQTNKQTKTISPSLRYRIAGGKDLSRTSWCSWFAWPSNQNTRPYKIARLYRGAAKNVPRQKLQFLRTPSICYCKNFIWLFSRVDYITRPTAHFIKFC